MSGLLEVPWVHFSVENDFSPSAEFMPSANVESGLAQMSSPFRMISKEPFPEISTLPTHSVAESRRSLLVPCRSIFSWKDPASALVFMPVS